MFIENFKSPHFYWHTGNKSIAVKSMIVSTAVMWFSLAVTAGFSIWGIIIALLLDAVGFWIALIYFFFLRSYIPNFVVDFQEKADILMMTQLLIPVFMGFFISRASSFFVAKRAGYKFHNLKACRYCGKEQIFTEYEK